MLQRLVSVLILSVLFFYSRYYQDVESAAVPITPDAPMQGVLELTDVNWSKNRMLQKTSQKPMLVMFYDPTCPFCKELAPIYAQFCKAVSESLYGDAILLGKFNMRATAQMVLLAGRIGVRGYPSIYLFYPSADEFASVKQQQQQGEKKKFVEFFYDRNVKSLVRFVQENTDIDFSKVHVEDRKYLVELDYQNFDRIVKDPKRNVAVLFYTKWCGFSQRFMPIWEEVSQILKNEPEAAIAQYDCEADDKGRGICPKELNINSFPTIILFAKENKKGIIYDNNRSAQQLVEFIQHQGNFAQHLVHDEL